MALLFNNGEDGGTHTQLLDGYFLFNSELLLAIYASF